MKKVLIVIVAVAAAFTSCKKEDLTICETHTMPYSTHCFEYEVVDVVTPEVVTSYNDYTGWYGIEVENGKWYVGYSEELDETNDLDYRFSNDVCYSEAELIDSLPYLNDMSQHLIQDND